MPRQSSTHERKALGTAPATVMVAAAAATCGAAPPPGGEAGGLLACGEYLAENRKALRP